jgi:hypothetical protein
MHFIISVVAEPVDFMWGRLHLRKNFGSGSARIMLQKSFINVAEPHQFYAAPGI